MSFHRRTESSGDLQGPGDAGADERRDEHRLHREDVLDKQQNSDAAADVEDAAGIVGRAQ